MLLLAGAASVDSALLWRRLARLWLCLKRCPRATEDLITKSAGCKKSEERAQRVVGSDNGGNSNQCDALCPRLIALRVIPFPLSLSLRAPPKADPPAARPIRSSSR